MTQTAPRQIRPSAAPGAAASWTSGWRSDMDFLTSDFDFSMLSLVDLLCARDAFHPHLMHKANVVGTAVGRYLVRKTDPYPPKKPTPADHLAPRTLENSEVREYSWPCLCLLVEKWVSANHFGEEKDFSATD